MVTLHGYILRELLKSFALTILALTALFTMGGGLYNVLNVEGVTAGDIFTVLPMLIPVVLTLTMPVAALFATTMTYGRLAADNELVAARAAGINVHRLFLSAILLSVFVALLTVLSVNLVIPRFMKRIEYFALTNVRDFAFNRLLQQGYMRYAEPGKDQYTLTAQQVLNVAEQQLVTKGFEPPGDGVSYFWVDQPSFLMTDKNQQLKRFSVAEGGLVQFDTRNQDVKFTLYVKNARDYDGKRVVQLQNQKIGPYAREIPFSPKPSMVNLETLRRWTAAPWEAPKLQTPVEDFLGQLREHLFCLLTVEHLAEQTTLVLFDAHADRYELTAVSATPAGRSQVLLNDVTVARYPAARDDGQARPPMHYQAPRAKLRARAQPDRTWVTLELRESAEQPVLESVIREDGYTTQREKESVRIDDLLLPDYVDDQMQACTAAAVLDPHATLPTDDDLDGDRKRLQKAAQLLQRKVAGVIHFRMSFASSALVTILMGAALGVIFRGSRALAAFGLACIPFAAVAILISMGKQMTESEGSHDLGPFLIWGGLALVGLADLVILRFAVRR